MLDNSEQQTRERMNEIEELLHYDGNDKIIDSHEALRLLTEHQKRLGDGIRCGIESLDEAVGAFKIGTLTVISGHTGQGKTLLACSLLNDFATIGKQSIFFSLEMGFNVLSRFQTMPTFYMPKENTECTVQWIRKKIHEAKVKQDIDAVFIDHLGYLETAEHLTQRGNSLMLGDMVRYLSRVAKEFNVAVFLLTHTKDTVENRQRPTMEDIRDSGYIYREADYVLMVWRLAELNSDPKDKRYSKYSMISLEKHRYTGITHQLRVEWVPELSVFREA